MYSAIPKSQAPRDLAFFNLFLGKNLFFRNFCENPIQPFFVLGPLKIAL